MRGGNDTRKLYESRKGRLQLTNKMMHSIEQIVNSLTRDYNDRQDATQEALVSVLETPEGQTDSFYVSRAKFRARDWLRRERRIRNGLLEIESQEVNHADVQ